MFISQALAQTAGGPIGDFGGVGQFIPLVLIFAVFYFMLLRPQQKKMKDMKQMISELRRGDQIVTQGGIIGKISKLVNDDELLVEIADGVKIRIKRNAVAEVVVKGEPVAEDVK